MVVLLEARGGKGKWTWNSMRRSFHLLFVHLLRYLGCSTCLGRIYQSYARTMCRQFKQPGHGITGGKQTHGCGFAGTLS